MFTQTKNALKRLADCGTAEKVKIVAIDAGKGAERNLHSLGLHPGNIVSVVRKSQMGGPIVIEIRSTEIAIGRGLAKKIVVEEA